MPDNDPPAVANGSLKEMEYLVSLSHLRKVIEAALSQTLPEGQNESAAFPESGPSM
jgi:hypothetical protein